jgi:hypothetical protein
MTRYTIHFSSFYTHSPEILDELLRLPLVSKFVFPACIYVGDLETYLSEGRVDEEDILRIDSSDQFRWSMLPNIEDNYIIMSLTSDNGLGTCSTIRLKESDNDSVFYLQFDTAWLIQNKINVSVIKSLFEEVIPVFKAYSAVVYEKDSNRRLVDGMQKVNWYTVNNRFYSIRLGWITFFGPLLLELIGHNRLEALTNCTEKYELHDGVVFVLQEDPYEDNNIEHRRKLNQALDALAFV